MKVRPVIFSGPMVLALLAARKLQTRRLGQAWLRWSDSKGTLHPFTAEQWAAATTGMDELRRVEFEPGRLLWRWTSDPMPHQHGARPLWIAYPTIQPGDLLYVRESITRSGALIQYLVDHRTTRLMWGDAWKQDPRPSIHMPRTASRITLQISDVRLQRLQGINPADAIAEGIRSFANSATIDCDTPDPRAEYGALWDRLHGAGGWAANPLVLALTFKVHEANVDALLAEREKVPA